MSSCTFTNEPTAREIRGAREGKIRFGLVEASSHVLFLIYDIDLLTSSWSDGTLLAGARAVVQARDPKAGSGHRLPDVVGAGRRGRVS